MLNYASVQPLLVATAFCSSVNLLRLVLPNFIVFPVTVAAWLIIFIILSTVKRVEADKSISAEIAPKPPRVVRAEQPAQATLKSVPLDKSSWPIEVRDEQALQACTKLVPLLKFSIGNSVKDEQLCQALPTFS